MHTYTIAVKPYVLKFLMARYRPANNIWIINRQERIGKVIYSMLEHMPKIYSKSKLDYGAWLTIGICEDYAERRGLYLTNESIIDFNQFIKCEIIEQMVMYNFEIKNRIGLKKYKELYIRHNKGKKAKIHVVQDPNLHQYTEHREIIYDILKLYDITEDDFPYETISRAWRRLKLPMLIAS